MPRGPCSRRQVLGGTRRIVNLVTLSLLPSAVFTACQESVAPPAEELDQPVAFAITDNVVAKIVISPDSQMVFVGDGFKATAKPKNAAGQLLTRSTINWSVAATSIAKATNAVSPTGAFKALKAGSTTIKAATDGKSRTAKVVVRSVTGAKVVVAPATATVKTGGTVQFTASGLTSAKEQASVNVTWTATGGTISTAGLLKAGTVPGTYQVTATASFGSAKAVVTVTQGSPPPAATLILVPATTTVQVGGTVKFAAYGRTSAGDSIGVTSSYTASGGSIASSGMFTAGQTPGTYQVIANSGTLADTSQVVITSGSGEDRVLLQPDIAASRAGATTRFVASVFSGGAQASGASTSYNSTCGSIGSTGSFTAPQLDNGSCLVIAAANGKADTTEVRLLPKNSTGIPYGINDLWANATATQASGVAAFTISFDGDATAATMVSHIAAARLQGVRLLMTMTGGAHTNYTTNGVFDLAKWQARMNQFNTSAVKAAIADGVADGTIIGNSVMDEPQQHGSASDPKTWGPTGTMTRARVDGLCSYVKQIFPTLPVGVFHDALAFDPDNSYRVCDFLIGQYANRKGNLVTWRDAQIQQTTRDGMAAILSLNVLDGGVQDKTGAYDCAGTGGLGTYAPNCSMTPQQIRDWGKTIGQSACAVLAWRYQTSFMDKPENQAAFADVALTLSQLPRRPCTSSRGPNTPPIAAFSSNCTDLSCDFSDESRDPDGSVVAWSWSFGDGTSSTAQSPSHAYAAAGTYQVTLTATDNRGATASVIHSVTVTAANQPPAAAFSSSCTDLGCDFTDASTDDGTISSWSWNFGDGKSSTTQSPSHTYDQAGTYQVTLTVTDNKNATGNVTHSVTVTAANQSPAAAFSSSCTDLGCDFTDASTDDGTVSSWSWDFGDGKSATTQNPSHTYTAAGQYDVTLTVTDNKGATNSVTHSVTVTAANRPPEAAFSSNCTDLGCDFTDASTDDGAVVSWSWDFGDGSSSSAQSPSHTYSSDGPYTVTLVVTDDGGATATVSQDITVTSSAAAGGP